jgi:hypothetical protein
MQSFGHDPVIKSTMSKLNTLLDDFTAYRKSVPENKQPPDIAYQDLEVQPKPSTLEKRVIIQEPKKNFSSINLQDLNPRKPPNASKPADLPSPTRRKPATPKKLKPSTESTVVTPARKNLSYDNFPATNSTNSSPSLNEQNFIKALITDSQFQARLAEQINTHMPSDPVDLPQDFFQNMDNGGLSTNAVQEIISSLTLDNYFNPSKFF